MQYVIISIAGVITMVIGLYGLFRHSLKEVYKDILKNRRDIDRLKEEHYSMQVRYEHFVVRLKEIMDALDKRYKGDKQITEAKKSIEQLQKTDRFEDIIHNEDDEH